MVLCEYRNGPIGPLLIKKVNETLKLALTLHVEEAPLNIFKGLGWKHAGVIPQYVYLQDPYALLRNLRVGQLSFLHEGSYPWLRWLEPVMSQSFTRFSLASFFSVNSRTFRLLASLRRPRQGPGNLAEETGFDAAYDRLWERVKGNFGALVVRDRSYLETRFGQPLKTYRLLTYRHHNQLLGYCIVKLKQFSDDPRMGCMRIATIVDCLFDPADPQGLQSLVAGAIQLGRKEKVHAIFCTASYLPLQKLLSLNGFIKIPGNLNFAYFDKNNHIQSDISLAAWHLMRGDSDADSNF